MEEEHFAFESYRFLFSPKVTNFLGPYPQCYVLDLGSVGQPVCLELWFSLLPPPILPATMGSSRQRWACSALWGGEAIFLWGSTGQGSGWHSQSLLLIPSLNDDPKDNPYLSFEKCCLLSFIGGSQCADHCATQAPHLWSPSHSSQRLVREDLYLVHR